MLVSTISRQCSGVSFRKPRAPPKPALAKATSIRPKAESAASTMRCWSSHSATSQATASARPGPPSSSASSSRRPIERAASTTRHPSALARRAVAAPIPEEAPVIRSTRSVGVAARLLIGCLLPCSGVDALAISETGGRGGQVALVCDDSLRDLQEFRRKTHYSAGRGGHGEGALRHGADGETLLIRVPPGTQIAGPEGEEGDLGGRRWELLAAGQRAAVARGGSGGKGDKSFSTPTPHAPRLAPRGPAGGVRLAGAAAQAARGRRSGGDAQRRQVLAAGAADARGAQGRGVSLHDPVSGPGGARRRGTPAGRGRHSGPDRGRQRGCRPGPRLPGTRGAHARAGARARSGSRAVRRRGRRRDREPCRDRARAAGP